MPAGCTLRYGYAVPFTTIVSMNDSGTSDGLGVPGIHCGSHGRVAGS